MIEINDSKCISRYSRNKRIMNGRIIIFGGVTIAVLSLFFGSDHIIGNQKVFASGYGHGFAHFYHADFSYFYSPGYPINPCGGGPYGIINGQIVCTPG
jgi:hypothetical protein